MGTGGRWVRSLSWQQRRWLAEAALLNAMFRVVVRVCDVHAAERLAARLAVVRVLRGHALIDSVELGESIRVASRLPLARVACLPRSLTALAMLGRRGVPARLHLGVSSSDGSFAAHAWTTVDGVDITSEPCERGAFDELHSGSLGEGMFDRRAAVR